MDSIPGLQRSPREGNGKCSILAWEIRGDEHGGLQSTGSQKSQTLLATKQQPVQIKYVKGTFLDSTNKP